MPSLPDGRRKAPWQLGNTKALRHGHAKPGQLTRTYRIWANIKTRCTNRNVAAFKDYGGRGIFLCVRWKNFDNFLADMGECPPGMQIDRINNTQGYEPANCRWTTAKQNSRNRRSTIRYSIDGKEKTIPAWAEHFKVVRACTIYERVGKGLDILSAATKPISSKRKNGKPYVD